MCVCACVVCLTFYCFSHSPVGTRRTPLEQGMPGGLSLEKVKESRKQRGRAEKGELVVMGVGGGALFTLFVV